MVQHTYRKRHRARYPLNGVLSIISAYFVVNGARLWLRVEQLGVYHIIGMYNIIWQVLV